MGRHLAGFRGRMRAVILFQAEKGSVHQPAYVSSSVPEVVIKKHAAKLLWTPSLALAFM